MPVCTEIPRPPVLARGMIAPFARAKSAVPKVDHARQRHRALVRKDSQVAVVGCADGRDVHCGGLGRRGHSAAVDVDDREVADRVGRQRRPDGGAGVDNAGRQRIEAVRPGGSRGLGQQDSETSLALISVPAELVRRGM